MSNELLRLQDQLKKQDWEEYKKANYQKKSGLSSLFSSGFKKEIELKIKFEISRKVESQMENVEVNKQFRDKILRLAPGSNLKINDLEEMKHTLTPYMTNSAGMQTHVLPSLLR